MISILKRFARPLRSKAGSLYQPASASQATINLSVETSAYTAPFFTGEGDLIYSIPSYSQEGEDMILKRVYDGVSEGFYIDVGAHHPKRFSNTYFFYEIGWSGINIDATPGSMRLFEAERPRDVNIEAAIASEQKEMTFFIFNEPALNSFDEELSRSRVTDQHFIVKEQKIITKTLKGILAEHLPKDQKVNFLSIDVEGLDLDALKSNDWQLCRPEYILVECFGMGIREIQSSEVYTLLAQHDYDFFAKTVNTVFFKDTLL